MRIKTSMPHSRHCPTGQELVLQTSKEGSIPSWRFCEMGHDFLYMLVVSLGLVALACLVAIVLVARL